MLFPACVPAAAFVGPERAAGRAVPCCVSTLGEEGLVLDGVLTLQLSVLSAVPHVLCTSTLAFCVLYGNGDPNCRGYTATEENGGDGGCAGA